MTPEAVTQAGLGVGLLEDQVASRESGGALERAIASAPEDLAALAAPPSALAAVPPLTASPPLTEELPCLHSADAAAAIAAAIDPFLVTNGMSGPFHASA